MAWSTSPSRSIRLRNDDKIKAGETQVITEPEKGGHEKKETAKIIDLTELLKQSLAGSRKGMAVPTAKSPPARKPANRKRA